MSHFTPLEAAAVVLRALRLNMVMFLVTFFLVFVAGLIALTAVGAVPAPSDITQVEAIAIAPTDTAVELDVSPSEAVDDTADELATTSASGGSVAPVPDDEAFPVILIFDSLNGRELPVLNPQSRAVADLDAALLSGVVRHPDSARFGQEGTMFILGHSSYLPSVNNRFFQAFNGIQNLTWGDTIRVRSSATEYVYQVERVYEAKASELDVPIATRGQRLTLATCDSFGSKDDRYIVEAVLLYAEPLATASL
jgi:LPXTG-site transpeptidase (sortase) family protein